MAAEIGDLDPEGAYASDSTIMILTCPECATRYFVADDRIGPEGRTVRCASCGSKWTALPDEPLELDASPEEGAVASEPREAEPDLTALSGDELPKAFRERAQTRIKVREAAAQGVVWAVLVGGVALILATAVVLRQDVARVWPRMAGVYALLHMPVNLVGLAIENQHAQPALKDGHAALVVTGSLRNVRDRPIPAPALRISLINGAGKVVAVKIADPGGARIPPGEARRFSVDLLDPPVSAQVVEIAFVVGGSREKGAPATPVAPPPVRAELRGPASPSASDTPLMGNTPPGEGGPPPAAAPPTTGAPAPTAHE
ncbi:MAG: DUF3426 domain-containing protein [Caulobacteraceae bacterium]|nr:DUF3426 domain-containing protein [Caulobacteraceae bacterium]